jgi:hypothetical protein
MGDLVDLSAIKYVVRMIDFRVFVSLWCSVDMRKTYFYGLCCAVSSGSALSDDYTRCQSMLTCLGGSEKVVFILYRMTVEQQFGRTKRTLMAHWTSFNQMKS